jgi:hypothetical protein
MGFFDGLTASCFKTDEAGNKLFYPYGVIGKGFVLGSAGKERKIRKLITNMYVFVFVLILLPFMHSLIGLGVILLFSIACYFIIKKATKGCHVIQSRLKLGESLRASAEKMPLLILLLLEAGCIGFIFVAAQMMVEGHQVAIPILGITFFGIGLVSFGYQIIHKFKKI